MRLSIEVVVRRGPIAESRHRVHAVISRADATAADEPGLLTTFRSAAKPFQLLPLVERGHADTWGFADEQLAVMAASHTGSRYHLDLVRGILARAGLGEEDLACGYHDPLDAESLDHVHRDPAMRSPLHNNCSGKHAGMLCLARSEGWPTAGYHLESHPLQQLMRRTVAECCGLAAEEVVIGVDGCSVPVFAVPLAAMARGYARFAAAAAAEGARGAALARIRGAMLAYPQATGGAARFSTALMEAAAGALVAKGGAEGLECLGSPPRRLGIAVKCEDGSTRAVAPAVIAVLESQGLLAKEASAALESWRRPVLHNAAGLSVGHLEARLEHAVPVRA